ncbi:hypothetical protein TL16_g09247 [Triparma laevis f. inornata]|uniref:Uncharacterized protein n=1 Tax=Triparma laevis f. inornata TaxID=1714386 RepID=A0A9W7EKZ2_9STRA|nr:hypothetical protein TL16_g09247 [Triparma laevis f. inornata]
MSSVNALRRAMTMQRSVLQDKLSLLNSVNNFQYTSLSSTINATIGQHIRHSLHHTTIAFSLLSSPRHVNSHHTARNAGNYDDRPRADKIETDIDEAKELINEFIERTEFVEDLRGDDPCTVTFSTSPEECTGEKPPLLDSHSLIPTR